MNVLVIGGAGYIGEADTALFMNSEYRVRVYSDLKAAIYCQFLGSIHNWIYAEVSYLCIRISSSQLAL